jgi:hypothetical protein
VVILKTLIDVMKQTLGRVETCLTSKKTKEDISGIILCFEIVKDILEKSKNEVKLRFEPSSDEDPVLEDNESRREFAYSCLFQSVLCSSSTLQRKSTYQSYTI